MKPIIEPDYQEAWNWKTGKSRPTPALLRKIKKVF